MKIMNQELHEAREKFIAQWGAMGTAWGINKTMAQIHALLMVSPAPLNTDEIMAQLAISRGHANTNLRELVNWGLARTVFQKGDRKSYFESEKNVWKMFCCIARERKRREVDPIIGALGECLEQTTKLKDDEAAAFNSMVGELQDFVSMVAGVLERIGRSDQSAVMPAMIKLLS